MPYQENKLSSELFNKVNACIGQDTPFVLYRLPHAQEVSGVFEAQPNTEADARFVFQAFERDQKGYEIPYTSSTSTPLADFKFSKSKGLTLMPAEEDEKNRFITAVKKAQQAIAGAELQKVVLSRSVTIPGIQNPQHLFKRLVHSYSSAFCYWWFHPATGHWLGASPELLLSTRGNTAEIISLAGTRKSKAGETVIWKEKEIEEQALVSNFIADVLESQGASIGVEGPTTVQAGTLAHLSTRFTAKLQSDPASLLKELHPTPAVCGLPKDLALQFIKEHEGYTREYYTGYLGTLASNPEVSSALYVNLRCMKYEDNMTTVYVGCGITAQSDPEKEWQETVDKCQTMFKILDISSH